MCPVCGLSEAEGEEEGKRERGGGSLLGCALLCLVSVYIHIVKEREETFIFKGKKASEDLKSTPRSLRE